MLLINILSFTILVQAVSLENREAHNNKSQRCCDTKCYKALEYGDSHGNNAKKDCKSYQRATVTLCPKTVSTTVTTTTTVTETSYAATASNPVKRDAGATLEERNNQPACTKGVSRPTKVPAYASKACSPSQWGAACSCLGVLPTTTTLPRETTTKTKTKTVTTTTTTVIPIETACSVAERASCGGCICVKHYPEGTVVCSGSLGCDARNVDCRTDADCKGASTTMDDVCVYQPISSCRFNGSVSACASPNCALGPGTSFSPGESFNTITPDNIPAAKAKRELEGVLLTRRNDLDVLVPDKAPEDAE